MKTGVVFEGVFYTANTEAKSEKDFGIVLNYATKIIDPSSKDKDRSVIKRLVIYSSDFVEIEAKDLPVDMNRNGLGGFTDSEISGNKIVHGAERDLVAWTPSADLDAKAMANLQMDKPSRGQLHICP
eukprot:SAG31_NODE_13444_length_869_cov_0.893506_1_plen_127_part_00